MTDGIFYDNLVENGSIVERNCQRIGNGSFRRVMIVLCELGVFHTDDLLPEQIDPRVRSYIVFIIGGGQSSEDQRHSNHILNSMIPVCGIIQRTFFIDDADRRLMRPDGNGLYILSRKTFLFQLLVKS